MTKNQFPYLEVFSKDIGIPKEKLLEAFAIEKKFHQEIFSEPLSEKRKTMYSDMYNAVHEIYGSTTSNLSRRSAQKDKIVTIFKKELEGKKILDVGCGTGLFLESIARNLKYERLVGLDVYLPELILSHPTIKFFKSDIIDFSVDEKFDIVFSDQVMEHIASTDIGKHLNSIRNALSTGGTLILLMPNRLFGPSDVTRIIDYSYSGRVPAQGSHLNELTYWEIITILKENGFSDFKTILPIPKIRRLFNNIRISPLPIAFIEHHPLLLNLLRSVKYNGRCVFRLGIILICKLK